MGHHLGNGFYGGFRPGLPWATRPLWGRAYFPRLKALPPSVDLRDEMPPIYDQGDEGSCTAWAWKGAIQHLVLKEKLPDVDLSAQDFYYQERVHGGYTLSDDTGASLSDGAWVAMKMGWLPESGWAYVPTQLYPPPASDTGTRIDLAVQCISLAQDEDQIKAALAEGYGMPFGISVYQSFVDAKNGVIPMPDPSRETLRGGHAIVLVGYTDGAQRFIFRNSWSTAWGQMGYGTLPYRYVLERNLASDFWAPRVVQ